jgi:hypothetical protein
MGDSDIGIALGLAGLLGLFGAADWSEAHFGTGRSQEFSLRLMARASMVVSWLVRIGVFLYGWYWAYSEWGWLLGLAFGWIPALVVAALAGALWWVGCFLLALVLIFK